jgi:hypothetical protein
MLRPLKRLRQAWLWTTETGSSQNAHGAQPLILESVIYFVMGFGVAAIWTLAGFLVAWMQSDQNHFVAEWLRMQAFFCLGFGVWLLLIARSGALANRARKITKQGSLPPRGIVNQFLRVSVVFAVGVTGTIVFIMMGFNAHGALLVFMWTMCFFICFLAGLVTLHAVDLIVTIHNLQHTELKTHRYAPARTPELRELVSYFTFFSLILTIAYAFACVGTLQGQWTGNPSFIEVAQLFWPAIYVPACSIALIYPHIVIHKLIQREKDETLTSYQREIDELLENFQTLKDEDVQRINTLSQVFDRFSSTPNYVFDFGIAARTVLPHLVNAGVFFAKPLLGQAMALVYP